MHKGYVRRTLSLWGTALILAMIGIFFLFGTIKGYMGGEALYKMGDIYHLNDAGTSVSIRVLDIDLEAVTYDGNEYYLVKHEKGVTPLQAQANDIQQLLDLKKANPNDWEPLKQENIYLNVRVTPAVTKGRKREYYRPYTGSIDKSNYDPISERNARKHIRTRFPSLFNTDIFYKSFSGDGGYAFCHFNSFGILLRCI